MRWVASLTLTLALGCGPEPVASAPVEPVAAQGGETEASAELEGKWHHFWIIHRARDAVMHGDEAAVRGLLARIADGDVGEAVEVDWMVWIEEMQDEALRAQRAKSMPQLAEIVSLIATRCADCHRSVKGPPRTLSLHALEQLAHGRAGGDPARADHRWSADELWLGMTVPLHQAWVRGSAALIDSPLHAPPPSDDAAAEVGRKLHANGRPLIDGAGVCQLDRALYFVPRLIAQPPDAGG
jgi:hypothetical protein